MTKSAVRKMKFILRIKTLLSARAAGVLLPKKLNHALKVTLRVLQYLGLKDQPKNNCCLGLLCLLIWRCQVQSKVFVTLLSQSLYSRFPWWFPIRHPHQWLWERQGRLSAHAQTMIFFRLPTLWNRNCQRRLYYKPVE